MIREYWTVGKPGYAWCLIDTAEQNIDLIKEFEMKYPETSHYFNSQKIVAITFEVPVAEVPSTFKRIS